MRQGRARTLQKRSAACPLRARKETATHSEHGEAGLARGVSDHCSGVGHGLVVNELCAARRGGGARVRLDGGAAHARPARARARGPHGGGGGGGEARSVAAGEQRARNEQRGAHFEVAPRETSCGDANVTESHRVGPRVPGTQCPCRHSSAAESSGSCQRQWPWQHWQGSRAAAAAHGTLGRGSSK